MTLYDQIKDDLLAKIKDGTYPEGQTIPSEVELADMYGVSRPTIRQALQILVSDGYLEKRRRRGTVVTSPKVSQSFTMSISSFEDAMRLAGRMPKTNVLVFKREHAGAEVAKQLELAPGQEVAPAVRRHAAKCNRRLQDRREAMAAAGKRPVVANCATAREMACWVWAIGRMASA